MNRIQTRICGIPWLTKRLEADHAIGVYLGNVRICSWRRKFKLGVAYSLFDGEELLEASIRSIRDNVDFITVIYQEVSYTGELASDRIPEVLASLKARGLVDNLVLFKPDLQLDPPCNETNKRRLGMLESLRHGCTHHLDMDVDEFYRAEEFRLARDKVEVYDYDSTACAICNHLGSPRYRDTEDCGYFVPFIVKIPRNPRKHWKGHYPVIIDPSRCLLKGRRIKFWLFPRDELAMYHYPLVRKDLKKKWRNASRNSQHAQHLTEKIRERSKLAEFVFGHHERPADVDFANQKPIRLVDDEFGIGEVGF